MPISKRQMTNAIAKIQANDDKALVLEALVEILNTQFNEGIQSDWDATNMLKNLCTRKHKDVDQIAQENGNMTKHISSSKIVKRSEYTAHKYFRLWHS